jgi:oleandomycin transport system permease protein
MAVLTPPVPTPAPARRIDPTRRISPVRALQHTLTLAWRSLIKIKHSPEQLLDLTLQPIIFVCLFYFLFGGAISGGDRHAYLQYLVPGILVQTVMFASQGTGVNLNNDLTKGIFDRFKSLPIARSAPLTGLILGDVVRYVISIGMVLGFSAILGFRIETDALSALAACALIMFFAFALSWVPALLGLVVKTPQQVQGFGFIVFFPLTFGSNVFVPTGTLPGWLQAWVKINPVSAVVDVTRALLLHDGGVWNPLWRSLAWCFVLIAVFAPIAVRLYRRHS